VLDWRLDQAPALLPRDGGEGHAIQRVILRAARVVRRFSARKRKSNEINPKCAFRCVQTPLIKRFSTVNQKESKLPDSALTSA
jgi:hypothetical protein